MKISLITNGDFGKYSNLRTEESEGILKYFLKEHKVNQVICRRSSLPNNIYYQRSLFGMFIYASLWYFDKIIGSKSILYSRYDFTFFDYEVSLKLKKSESYIFLPFTYLRSIRKAKKLGGTTITLGTSAPSVYSENLRKEEFKKILSKEYKLNVFENQVLSLKESDYIIAYSNLMKSVYVKCGVDEKKIFVCYPGVDIDKFSLMKIRGKDKKFRVIMVADLSILKGVQYLLRAWNELKLKNSELLLIGNISEEVRGLVKYYLDKDESIKLIGHTKDVAKLYKKSSIFVHPSLTEGFERVSLEAMACGLPVIVSSQSGASEIVTNKKEGFVFSIRDVETLKDKIKYFYDNPDEVERMGKNARKLAQKHTWGDFSRNIYKITKTIARKEGIK